MIAQHGRFLDGTETAHLFGERQEFYAGGVIGGSQGRENAGDKLFILRDQRSLRAPLGGITEQIELILHWVNNILVFTFIKNLKFYPI